MTGTISKPAPRLGEHNRELLAEIGVDEARYAKLLADGIACETTFFFADGTVTTQNARLGDLIQAQRDYFGAHTYQRVDKEGNFHTPDWDK